MSNKELIEVFIKLAEMSEKDAEKLTKKILDAYDTARARVIKALANFYTAFAEQQGLSLTDAKKLLTESELRQFRLTLAEYIKLAESEPLDRAKIKQLERNSAKVRIARLEALQTEIQANLDLLTATSTNLLTEGLAHIYNRRYYYTLFQLEKGYGVGYTFEGLNAEKVKAVLNRAWAADGKNYTERLLFSNQKLANILNQEITQALIQGENYQDAARRITERIDISQRAARRLVQTETAYIATSAQEQVFKELDIDKYQFIATLDLRTSAACRDMDGKVFKLSDMKAGTTAPPLHCNCRSCTAPYFAEFTPSERWARDQHGKRITVPADWTYSDWYKHIITSEN